MYIIDSKYGNRSNPTRKRLLDKIRILIFILKQVLSNYEIDIKMEECKGIWGYSVCSINFHKCFQPISKISKTI